MDDDYYELSLFADELDKRYFQQREHLADVNAYDDETYYLDDDYYVLTEDGSINFWELLVDALVRKHFAESEGVDEDE